jgi:hypothetical protein
MAFLATKKPRAGRAGAGQAARLGWGARNKRAEVQKHDQCEIVPRSVEMEAKKTLRREGPTGAEQRDRAGAKQARQALEARQAQICSRLRQNSKRKSR